MWKSWPFTGPADRTFVRLVGVFLLGFSSLHVILIYELWDRINEGYGDFTSFYTAGKIVQRGNAGKLYDPPTLWRVQQEFASKVKTRRGPLPYVRPPFEALLFVPFSWLRYGTAWQVWSGLKIALLVLIAFVAPVSSELGASRGFRLGRLLLCGAFFPLGLDLVQGQDSILLLLLFTLAARFLTTEAYFECGLVLGLGLFKPHLIIPFVLILAVQKGGRKIATGFVAAGIPLFLISLAMVHWTGVVRYPKYLWTLNQVPGMGMVKTESMPNFRGLAAVLFPRSNSSVIVHLVLLGIVALGIVVAARAWSILARRSVLLAFSFAIVVILVTSYYAYCYDLTLVLLPLWFIGEQMLTSRVEPWARTMFMIAAGILLCAPLCWSLVFATSEFAWTAALVMALAAPTFAIGRSSNISNRVLAGSAVE
jgi:Glycosyltransferase family 87